MSKNTSENTLSENTLRKDNVLICIDPEPCEELDYIKANFCGVVYDSNDVTGLSSDIMIYICGNIELINNKFETFRIIKELSIGYETTNYTLVSTSEVPVNIHNVGVYFKSFFNADKDYFSLLSNEHEFQALSESNKPGSAYRKGIYLTKVEESNNEIKYNLLRCSTNLDGPTDNFRNTDYEVINKVNEISKYFFEQKVELNHVLAQIYNNTVENNKDKKAKIKEHSDKTKDMPRNALMAFCTFYKGSCNNENSLTKLRFRLKKMITDKNLVEKFDLILSPNSVFIMLLQMNRLYTHEIIPPILPVGKIPTRMGYVIRCSKTQAVFKNGQTYIGDKPLEKPTENDITELKNLYFKENATDEIVEYGPIYYSLNDGDYLAPIQ